MFPLILTVHNRDYCTIKDCEQQRKFPPAMGGARRLEHLHLFELHARLCVQKMFLIGVACVCPVDGALV